MFDRLKMHYYLLQLESAADYLNDLCEQYETSPEKTIVLGLMLKYAYKALRLTCLDHEERARFQQLILQVQQVHTISLLSTTPPEYSHVLGPIILRLASQADRLIVGTDPITRIIQHHKEAKRFLSGDDEVSLTCMLSHERSECIALEMIIIDYLKDRLTRTEAIALINANIRILEQYHTLIISGPPIPESLRSITQQLEVSA